jgi:hypothetical protein
MKKDAHYKYKLAVRDAMTLFEHKFTDDLLNVYFQKDCKKFWETWQKKSHRGMTLLSHIEGSTDDRHILLINVPITSTALI